MPNRNRRAAIQLFAAGILCFLATARLGAQATGAIRGTVARDGGIALSGANVTVTGTGLTAVTSPQGQYLLGKVPVGRHTVEFRMVGYAALKTTVEIVSGQTATVDASLGKKDVRLADVIVVAPSRGPERIVEAPAAIAIVPPEVIAATAPTGQAPLVLTAVPGVDVVQSGITDFNVNARGINSSLTRRVLVLQDGRDAAIAFLGAQEWAALGASLDDFTKIEMVRGPGSALYGANAFSGVLTLTSATAREAAGTRVSLAGGELGTRRVDARQAGVFGGDRFGYKLALGYGTSDTWARSRTKRDSSDIVGEYTPVTDSTVKKSREARALNGQSLDPTTLAATGDRDPVTTAYGSARLDYYAPSGALGTIEGGMSDLHNETLVTGLGRVQVSRAKRPWGRAAWNTDHLNLLAWYTGRDTPNEEWSLGSGSFFLEKSSVMHGEIQYNNDLFSDRGRWIVGASARSTKMNTSHTLLTAANDDRTDQLYSVFGQVEFKVAHNLKLVGATRWDDGSLFDPQFSPKAALVYTLNENSSLRASVNRAFQSPNYSELFLNAVAGAPTASPRALETAINGLLATGRSIGTPGLPAGALPWNFDAQTSVKALGNSALSVEKITGYEVGYQTAFLKKGYVTLDLFWNDAKDFVTDLLPNVNPAYPQFLYTANGTNVPAYLDAIIAQATALPAGAISDAQRAQILGGAQALKTNYNALVAGTQPLLAMVDGHPTLVVSYTNAGRVAQRGSEIGVSTQVTDDLRLDANYAFFEFSVKRASAGTDALLPNTPKHKGSIGVVYQPRHGFDLGGSVRIVSGYPWAAGVYNGYIPASQSVNANASYQATPQIKLFVTGTNVLDQRRFQIYGGSVVGRRVLAGASANW